MIVLIFNITSIVNVFMLSIEKKSNSSFFSIWVFLHDYSRFTGQQGKGKAISFTRLYHFHPLHRHLDISRAITPESSPLCIDSSRTRTGNLWFPSASGKPNKIICYSVFFSFTHKPWQSIESVQLHRCFRT